MLDPRDPGAIGRELRKLVEAGTPIDAAGEVRGDPTALLRRGYTPKFRADLFDVRFYLTRLRQNDDGIRFFVGWLLAPLGPRGRPTLYPRILYKDLSLIWRSASHFIRSEHENWLGKGDVIEVTENGETLETSAEWTTDLPFELQTALEDASRRMKPVRDDRAVALVLRRAPDDRIAPYRDFTGLRERAARNAANLPNRGRPIARFRRPGDPASLEIAKGFEPDFDLVLERTTSASRLYGGKLRRSRVLSRNEQVQYLFFAGRRHVWLAPPQALTTELTSYGVRSVDVVAPEDLFVPGFEYHYLDDSEDPPVWVSQIPKGYAGRPADMDPTRCDASPWLDQLPIVKAYRAAHRR